MRRLKINSAAVATAKAEWLPVKAYTKYANHIIATNSNDEGVDIDAISAILKGHAKGDLTAKGYQVSVRYMMGAISKISKELADAISEEPAESEYF